MELTEEKQLSALGFEITFSSEYADLFKNESRNIIACILKSEYVPIASFRETFNRVSSIARSGRYQKFIFDKRSLTTFHQPSMEWYFLSWKTEMLDLGIYQHRKLLPDQDWFIKAVEIAREPLIQKFPEGVWQKLDIKYCDSLEEAVSH